ncbi:FAD-binding oxidoreductase [Roseicella aerolata]|uniref:2Fe-2S iron-sulfur cluster binding domain-containing protein n=1 Tax=Roseicella aerolata TaxID=2883479 RepID=A0A9X1LDB8_9PROT|nr:FAD-binding oxidoreductase [Roseicella aerolata]MCB4824933.1 2Fe-2S iron-sulfur cluster binding domain-containing protein [Roseicella aerolata]
MGGGPRPFYAALLDMPALTPEARRFIEAEAERRIGWGSQAIAAGHAQLSLALASNDPAAVQQAANEVRSGVLRLESGTAALQAIAAGTPPRQFAQAWFREQLSISSPEAAPMVMEGGPWGLSWYHLTTMAFLVAFLLGALMIQYARMRRIGGLVERLTPGGAPGAAAAPKRDDATSPGTLAPDKGVAEQPAAPAARPVAATPDAPASAKKPWSGKLRVAAIFRETDTVKTFRLMNPEGGDIPFTFLAGQFITLAAEIDGKPVRRSYTIASSACQRSYVEIAIKREDHGAESRHLHDQVAVGDQLQVSGPSGAFTFTGEEADSIVLISGGIGITPMMCVVRCLNDKSYSGDIFFLHGARRVDDFVFHEELGYLQKRHPNLHVVATMGKVSATPWDGAQGPVSKEFIAQAVPDIAHRRVHICGPPAMMEAVKTSLLELGVAQNKIKTEAFGAAQGRVPSGPEPTAAAPPGPVPGDAPVAPAPAALPSAAAQVEFTTSGKTAPLAPDQTVLEAAEAIGVEIDYACRVGTCGTCVVPLKSGEVTMAVEDGLPTDEKAKGIILACQAKSIGNLVVEA